jgi:hypothetical protein
MLKSGKSRFAAVFAVVAIGTGLMAAPATAPAQNMQEGLVNVAVEDVIVQIPIAVAANVCDVNVAVLAEVADAGGTCVANADSAASAGPSGNGGGTQQQGLVNILIDDVVVQVPIAVAANICDVNVAVLAEIVDAPSACEATAAADAQPGGGGGGQAASAAAFDPVAVDLGIQTLLNNNPDDNIPSPLPTPVVGPGAPTL